MDLPPCLLAGLETIEEEPSSPTSYVVDHDFIVLGESVECIDQSDLVLVVLRVVKLEYGICIRSQVVRIWLQGVLEVVELFQGNVSCLMLPLKLIHHELYQFEVVCEISVL